jgi:hypothetical protein
VPDTHDVVAEQVRRAGVVGVVGVDQMGHGVTDALGRRDLVHGPPQVVADGRRGGLDEAMLSLRFAFLHRSGPVQVHRRDSERSSPDSGDLPAINRGVTLTGCPQEMAR